ncbi:MAG: hypothetical protein ACE5IW_11620 [bacterium]
MRKQSILIAFMLSLMMIWSACSDFVDEVDPLIDQVQDDLLNDEAQIPFLSLGVKVRFATTHDDVVVLADGLSDAFFFDSNVPQATFPTFKEVDDGDILLNNTSVDGMFHDLGELRFFADDLLRRVDEIGTFTDAEVEREARFVGNLFGGIARRMYASYFGLNPTEGGGVIDNGPFIPSADMYNLALEKFQAAVTYAGSPYETRVVNSLIARVHLYAGNASAALTAAQNGMVDGDEPFQALYSAENTNYVWQQAGLGRSQYVLDPRFNDYVIADPNEAARISFVELLGADGVTIYYLQTKYGDLAAPIDYISWQENELMLAELELASNNASALARVNAVRASHGIGPLATLDQTALIEERDKELLLTAARLVDQRRFGIWHLPAGLWQYLPITERERNNNPNF